MFYEKYQLHGNYGWQLSDFGKEYKSKRAPYLFLAMRNRLASLAILANKSYDCDVLADYVLNHRGRYINATDESTIEKRISSLTHYVYVTQSDKENVGVGVSTEFLGNSKVGYVPFTSDIIRLKDFIKDYVFIDDELERQLKVLYASIADVDKNSQLYYSRVQELKSLFKNLLI